ncbi:TPA: LysR substrate-binding domain-containing protein, partial [Vibrio vulnificus]
VTKNWCIDGQGIIQRSEWDVKDELKNGKLVRILPEYQLQDADIVALLSSDQFHRSQKVTAFLDYVKQRLTERL